MTDTTATPVNHDTPAAVSAQTRIERANRWRLDLVGGLIGSLLSWRMVAILLSLALLGMSVSNVILIVRHRIPPPAQPDIWLVNPEGLVLWHGPPGSTQITDIWMMGMVAQWIQWVRWRSPDTLLMGRQWDAALAMTLGEAKLALDEHLQRVHPKKRPYVDNPLYVSLPPKILPQKRSDKTYEVIFTEEWVWKFGKPQKVQVRAIVTPEWRPTINRDGLAQITLGDFMKSEMSVYITYFNFAEQILE